jgi:hypothetical protein
MYPDGLGLYLQVGEGRESASWIYRFNVNGRDRQMGLGPLHTIGLAEARELARQCREQRQHGLDPIEVRKAERRDQEKRAAKQITFRTCAEKWIEDNKSNWSPSYLHNTKNRIEARLYPMLGNLPVSAINVDLLEKVVKPISSTFPQVANFLLIYLRGILDCAEIYDHRPEGSNVARSKKLMGRLKGKKRPVKHHAALPYA